MTGGVDVPAAEQEGDATDEYLTFRVGGERCALRLLEVQEIVEFHRLTRVPLAPDGVLGVFNLRGMVVPVLDLASRLDLPLIPTPRSCLIVVRSPDEEDGAPLALLVECVDGVAALSRHAVQPAPPHGTRVSAHRLRGVVHGEGLLYLLDSSSVLRTGLPQALSASNQERS